MDRVHAVRVAERRHHQESGHWQLYVIKKGHPFEMSFSIKVAMTYSPTNLCSTIGAVGLNFSVRDGKRWIPDAINRLNKGIDALHIVQCKSISSTS